MCVTKGRDILRNKAYAPNKKTVIHGNQHQKTKDSCILKAVRVDGAMNVEIKTQINGE